MAAHARSMLRGLAQVCFSSLGAGTLDSSPEQVKYFMDCFEVLSLERQGVNPIIVNINGSGEFLSCRDVEKFQKVAKNIATELRAAGYMVWLPLFLRPPSADVGTVGCQSAGFTKRTTCETYSFTSLPSVFEAKVLQFIGLLRRCRVQNPDATKM